MDERERERRERMKKMKKFGERHGIEERGQRVGVVKVENGGGSEWVIRKGGKENG